LRYCFHPSHSNLGTLSSTFCLSPSSSNTSVSQMFFPAYFHNQTILFTSKPTNSLATTSPAIRTHRVKKHS
jgi:hypothetical protein